MHNERLNDPYPRSARLSVIIPCYNMEDYLPTCVDSLLSQDMEESDIEIIIVNDGSKDKTSSIAHSYTKHHSNIHVIDKENAGVGAARNSGLDKAQGELVYFLDPDDYLAKFTLLPLVEKMEELQTDILSFVSTNVEGDELPDSKNLHQNLTHTEVKDGTATIAEQKFRTEIWWYLIRRDFLIKNEFRFLEGRWMEDSILTAQIFCAAERVAHYPLDAHRYRILPTSAMRDKTPEHYNKLIFDMVNAAEVYHDLICNLPESHPSTENARTRLKTRQQSWVFFLLVRLMKSDLSLKGIRPLLTKFEPIDAYPLNQFLGSDFDGFSYRILVWIFNQKGLIGPFMRLYRIFNLNWN